MFWQTLSGIPSGILSDILSGIPSGILFGISSGILSGKHSGALSGISSGISSGILSYRVPPLPYTGIIRNYSRYLGGCSGKLFQYVADSAE